MSYYKLKVRCNKQKMAKNESFHNIKTSNKVWQFNLEGSFWKEEKSLQKCLNGHFTVAIEKQNGVSLVSLGGSQRDTNTHTNTDTENTQMIIVDIE